MSEVVVIGGGFAGLAAGVALAAGGARPLVLEGRPHLGGRARSFTDAASGERLDNGQHAMMGCYAHTLAFLDRIGSARRVVRQDRLRVAMAHPTRGDGVIAGAPLPGPLHMAGGVLGYRLLRRRERLSALRAGLCILRRYRRGDASLAERTVAELLTDLGQSPDAQASFWNPVAIATLNELPERAAAGPFAAVLARAFFGTRRDAQFVLPGTDLSALYVDAASAFITRRGGRVETHATVAGLEVTGRGVTAVQLRDGRRIATAACIAAVPPRALAALLPDALRAAPSLRGLEDFGASPIVSVHLWLDRPVLAETFLGCVGTTTQWLFNRSALQARGDDDGQRLSAVISAGHAIVDWPNERIADTVLADLRALVPAARQAQARHTVVVKEKHATISNTPAADRRRPAAATAAANLWLAGDWIATGLPPTIESAVMSGHHAAELLLARRPT
ncbi:MAG TPA: hydroxysqualene dehydroxylase HpnE [Candidatus Dormibacteraeota bacterium]|nr:hydroxysqualene dehydroxylase HpnE [Candidatus Dormibacteraeota bacterium]